MSLKAYFSAAKQQQFNECQSFKSLECSKKHQKALKAPSTKNAKN